MIQSGVIDCDIHPAVPATEVLAPYLNDYWREMLALRSLANLDLTSYPSGLPLSARPDWRPRAGKAGGDLAAMRRQCLEPFGVRLGILNCLHGPQVHPNAELASAFCRAINDWIAAQWLDKEPRLRASIVVPIEEPDLAVEEIERRAPDRRFVQVLMLAMGEELLGRRKYWPIYRAAERHDLPVGIHAGSSYRHAPTALGWPSFRLEDYVAQSQGFAAQLLSLVSEGVFAKFKQLRFVLIESGFTWLPSFLWRFDKTWRGLRIEVPWVDEPPSETIAARVRLTTQPFDAPPDPNVVERLMAHLGSDELLLFSSDFPHWQFDGEPLPSCLPASLVRKMTVDNPLSTYPRLKEALQ